MGATIKNSDRRKAQALAGITISDNDSLKAASKALEQMGLPAIKARITHDATASGLNGAALCPPFSYPSFANGLQLVMRDCWMAKNKVLIWVSDSLSAVWSINKGRCYADVSMITLEGILQVCDDRHLQILALWTLRESNELADYLSHLSTHMLRSRIAGVLSEGQGLSFSDSA
jgi:hypothetical protein